MKIKCCSLLMPVAATDAVGSDDVVVAVVVDDVRVHAAAITMIPTMASATRRRNMAAESIGGRSEQWPRRLRRPRPRIEDHAGGRGSWVKSNALQRSLAFTSRTVGR